MVTDFQRAINVMTGVNESLKFRKKNPKVSEEKIMDHLVKFLKSKKIKGAQQVEIIAGVSHALKLLDKKPKSSEKEIINSIVRDMKEILPKEE